LAVIGHWLMKVDFFAPLHDGVQIPMRQRDYTPFDKLPDCFIGILAGCTAIQQINVRLRPDEVLAQAWGRRQVAEQSTICGHAGCLHRDQYSTTAPSQCLLHRPVQPCLAA
jgi:hypothetical protein